MTNEGQTTFFIITKLFKPREVWRKGMEKRKQEIKFSVFNIAKI